MKNFVWNFVVASYPYNTFNKNLPDTISTYISQEWAGTRCGLDVGQENNLFEGDHENAVEEERGEHVLVNGNPRHPQDTATKTFCEIRMKM